MTARRIVAATAVIVAVILGVGWWVILDTTRSDIETAIEARRSMGYTVAYDDLAVGGFPWRMVVFLSPLSVAPPEEDGAAPWLWSAPGISIEIRIFAETPTMAFTVPETQRLDYGGRVMDITLERGVIYYDPANETPEGLDFDVRGIVVATPAGRFALSSLTGRIQRGPDSRLDVEIDGRDLSLPPRAPASEAEKILGREISGIGITASHDGALPESFSAEALAAWSANGGTVEFERLLVDWGALEMAAEGTLTLDRELRPEAAFSAEIAGYGKLLDGLAESGRMKPRDASFAKTFLNLMAKDKAGRRVIEAPITAQGGTLFIGPLPLFKLAPIQE
jgi:hypothetical protein